MESAEDFHSDLLTIVRPTNFRHSPHNAACYCSRLANSHSYKYHPPAAIACISIVNSSPCCTFGAYLLVTALPILPAMDNLYEDHLGMSREEHDRRVDEATDESTNTKLKKKKKTSRCDYYLLLRRISNYRDLIGKQQSLHSMTHPSCKLITIQNYSSHSIWFKTKFKNPPKLNSLNSNSS